MAPSTITNYCRAYGKQKRTELIIITLLITFTASIKVKKILRHGHFPRTPGLVARVIASKRTDSAFNRLVMTVY